MEVSRQGGRRPPHSVTVAEPGAAHRRSQEGRAGTENLIQLLLAKNVLLHLLQDAYIHAHLLTCSTVSPFAIKNSLTFSIFVSIIEKSLVRIQEGGREKLKLMKARQVEFAVAYVCINNCKFMRSA